METSKSSIERTLPSPLRQMIRIRLIEEAIADQYSKGEMRCPTHLSIGQEFPAVAFCSALAASDLVYSTHRSHAHYLAKGGSLKAMLAELMGKSAGCSGGFGGSMHLVDRSVGFEGSTAIVANSIPIALGASYAEKHKKSGSIVCVFFGEGATEEGVFYESINAAALFATPLLFVCENNGYSVYSPKSSRQPNGRNLVTLAKAMDIESWSIEMSDFSSALQRCHEAVDFVRSSTKPLVVELPTYRWREHCGHQFDDHLGYRPQGELEIAMSSDPCTLEIKRLLSEKAINQTDLSAWYHEVAREIEEAFTFARQAPFPSSYHAGLYD